MTASATENTARITKGKFWERKVTFVWETDDGHAAQSVTLNNLSGVLENLIAVITEVTGNPTVDITLTDENSADLLALSALADATTHIKRFPTDFDSVILPGSALTLSVDPSADAGGAAQTLTVTVILRGIQ
jgi:hypothetical protein